MIYIVLGAPGVGKGTRAKVICEKLGIPHISTGSLIRENNKIFEKYKGDLKDGGLIPDEAIKEMLVERLKNSDTLKGFVLDGYPRTLNQVKDLEEILGNMEKEVTKAFLFEAPIDEIYNRVLNRRVCVHCDKIYGFGKEEQAPKNCEVCGRELIRRIDDNEETIAKRLEVYEKESAPIINYYKEKGLLEVIDATLPKEKVLESI